MVDGCLSVSLIDCHESAGLTTDLHLLSRLPGPAGESWALQPLFVLPVALMQVGCE